MCTQLSLHFTLEELTSSSFAFEHKIDNTPSCIIIEKLKYTAQKMERVRAFLGGYKIIVSSGYRCPAVNVGVGGSLSSSHVHGLAVDFVVLNGLTIFETSLLIAKCNIEYDQLIIYNSFIHLGFGARNRRQFLSFQT